MSTTRYVNVNRTLQNLEDQLDPENVEAIHEFVDHCAAEGIGEVQQDRLVWSWKTLLQKFAPEGFRMKGASKSELKSLMAGVNRSDYADSTKIKFKTVVKKFYRIQNGGHEQPEKTRFFKVGKESSSRTQRPVYRGRTETVVPQLLKVRDRAFIKVLYESAARPGELLSQNIADFTSNRKGDFIYLQGLKGTQIVPISSPDQEGRSGNGLSSTHSEENSAVSTMEVRLSG